MPQVILTERARNGLERCQQFLHDQDVSAATRAARSINDHLTLLQHTPRIGRPLHPKTDLRELIIPFGSSGYTVLYRYHQTTNNVYILAFRHQKELDYSAG